MTRFCSIIDAKRPSAADGEPKESNLSGDAGIYRGITDANIKHRAANESSMLAQLQLDLVHYVSVNTTTQTT